MNEEIKNKLRNHGIRMWELSDAIGVSESTIYRWMRHELSKEQRGVIDSAIRTLKRGRV